MKGRRSSSVKLVALGTVLLGGCSDDLPDNRFIYSTPQACVREWGEANCQSRSSGGTSIGLGPRYGSWVNLPTGEKIYSGTPNSPSFHPQTGKHLGMASMPTRGGFGSSGHSFSSSSS